MTEPRDRYDLVPTLEGERAFVDAMTRGRLHHAWLLCGPEGVGKASFAYRAARLLLGGVADPGRGPLGTSPNDPVSRLISARAHPDLLVLERLSENGRVKKAISVDQARELPEFFAKSPSRARYRVAIVDSADDLNVNAANALLKILEEPPERGVVFLISHAPGRLLPTIRSRCRRLSFPPWPESALANLVLDQGEGADAARAIAAMAAGSPGRALALMDGAMGEADAVARRWIEQDDPDRAEVIKVGDGFRGDEGSARFEALIDRLAAHARVWAGRSSGTSARLWADLWTRLVDIPERTAGLNLDRADTLAAVVADVARTKALTRC